MNALFTLGNRASADEIRARLSHPPGDSAVRVMLARLEQKGWLRHQQAGPRYLYSASISPAAARRGAVQEILHTFFASSLPQMTTALLAEHDWTEQELAALEDEIARRRAEKRSAQ